MSNKTVETITTTAGVLKKVTLEEFIEEIPMEAAIHLVTQYNALTSYCEGENSSVAPDGLPQYEDSTYIRTAVILTENSAQQQLLHILDQVNFVHAKGTSRDEKIEDAAISSMEQFGLPTHLVEITHHCYGMFCLEDFKYKLLNPTKGAIICYAPNRNLVFRADYY